MRRTLLLLVAGVVAAGCGDDGSGSLHQQQDAEQRCIHVLEGGGTITECQDE